MTSIPSTTDDIEKIWAYVRTLDIPKDGGFTDWMEWMGWNGLQYKNYRENNELPNSLQELQVCLAACLERDIVSGDFKDGDERQAFPRSLVQRIAELTLDRLKKG